MRHNEADRGTHSLPLATRTFWFLESAVSTAFFTLLVIAATLYFQWPIPLWVIASIAAVVFAGDIALNALKHRWYRYDVAADSCRIVQGRFVRSTTTVASPQILHTEIEQGPLLRLFGLAQVRLALVVGSVALAPVAEIEAERIRATLVASCVGARP